MLCEHDCFNCVGDPWGLINKYTYTPLTQKIPSVNSITCVTVNGTYLVLYSMMVHPTISLSSTKRCIWRLRPKDLYVYIEVGHDILRIACLFELSFFFYPRGLIIYRCLVDEVLSMLKHFKIFISPCPQSLILIRKVTVLSAAWRNVTIFGRKHTSLRRYVVTSIC